MREMREGAEVNLRDEQAGDTPVYYTPDPRFEKHNTEFERHDVKAKKRKKRERNPYRNQVS